MAPSQLRSPESPPGARCMPGLCGGRAAADEAQYRLIGPPVIVKPEQQPVGSEHLGQPDAEACMPPKYQLSALDHSLPILGCINPKAFLLPYTLEAGRLRRALGLALGQFPLLAGRIGKYSRRQLRSLPYKLPYYVACTGEGVPVVEATCSLPSSAFSLGAQVLRGFSFNYLNIHHLPPYMQDIDVPRMLRGSEPPCKVQLTSLADGATILAISTSHALLDGRSFAMLVNALAAHYRALGAGAVLRAPAAGGGGPAEAEAAALLQQPVMDRRLLLPGNVPPIIPGGERAADMPASAAAAGMLQLAGGAGSSASLMRELSLAVQQVQERPALGGILRSLWRAAAGTLTENARFPRLTLDLTTEVLHIPQRQVAALKALALGPAAPEIQPAAAPAPAAAANGAFTGRSAGGAEESAFVSTNDAVAALFWITMCQLRGRPLPGAASSPGSNALGLAVDLRHNGLKGHLPPSYFGNAVWALYVDSCSSGDDDEPVAGAPVPAAADDPAAGQYAAVLRAASRRVRAALQRFRSSPRAGRTVADLAYRQHVAGARQSLDVLSRLYLAQDAFLTSWQFPYWAADFGGGGPLRYHGVVRPLPPWQAAVMAAHPADGGLYVFMTTPSSAVGALKASPVLRELVPDAYFPSDCNDAA